MQSQHPMKVTKAKRKETRMLHVMKRIMYMKTKFRIKKHTKMYNGLVLKALHDIFKNA